MLYPQYFIDDLKDRADLVRIIQPYVRDLKKKGANWMGCCPFHEEKTPSFSVSPSKGFYKCFGCGKGGSVYNFLMEMEGLNFPEAVQRVAEMSGTPLPEPVDDQQYERSKKKKEETKKLADQVIELNKIALEFWEAELQKKNAKAKAAREYLESRGITEEYQKAFRLGFSPDKWDALLDHLKGSGAQEKLIEQSGLVSVSEEKDRVFDRFRGRIMFPVLDISGNPVAFGARAMGDDQPKYLNSPETAAYVKGRHLYGLFQSKDEIRKKKFVILVEGYLDLIALYQFGITNVAASLGTAFTPEQSKLLSRFTKKLVINYDGDAAGIKAARKAIEQLLPQDFEIKVLVLPDGKDPDDFVRENGTEIYNEARGKAQPFSQFVLASTVRGRDLASARQKADAAEEVLPVVRAIRKDIQKRQFFDEVILSLLIQDKDLRNKLWKAVNVSTQTEPNEIKRLVVRSLGGKMTVAEQLLLELLVHDSELRGVVLPLLETSDYESLATADIFRALYQLEEKGLDATLDNLLELAGDDETAQDYIPLLMLAEPKREQGEIIEEVLHEAENCVFTLRSMAISTRSLQVTQELIAAEQNGDWEMTKKLASEQVELAKMKADLQRKIAQM